MKEKIKRIFFLLQNKRIYRKGPFEKNIYIQKHDFEEISKTGKKGWGGVCEK